MAGSMNMAHGLQLESVTMRNALMLLGEESSSSAAQPGKREGKRLMAAAAKNGSKSRKAAAHKKAAEQKPDRTATVWVLLLCWTCTIQQTLCAPACRKVPASYICRFNMHWKGCQTSPSNRRHDGI